MMPILDGTWLVRMALLAMAVAPVAGCNKAASPTAPSQTNCTGAVYSNPATSEYVLPYEVGTSRLLSQSNCDGFHNDLDWFAYDFDMPIGSRVLAARAGQVSWVQEQYVDGDHDINHANTIEITHADGSKAQYLHLTQNGAQVRLGDRVERGQFIGLSGFTGMTGSRRHLHFVVFEFINESGRKSLPVTFRNVRDPQPLVADKTYQALPY
jgi:murein DD-endopeptidase MepM/ murein hydrolase activator NlpD